MGVEKPAPAIDREHHPELAWFGFEVRGKSETRRAALAPDYNSGFLAVSKSLKKEIPSIRVKDLLPIDLDPEDQEDLESRLNLKNIDQHEEIVFHLGPDPSLEDAE